MQLLSFLEGFLELINMTIKSLRVSALTDNDYVLWNLCCCCLISRLCTRLMMGTCVDTSGHVARSLRRQQAWLLLREARCRGSDTGQVLSSVGERGQTGSSSDIESLSLAQNSISSLLGYLWLTFLILAKVISHLRKITDFYQHKARSNICPFLMISIHCLCT